MAAKVKGRFIDPMLLFRTDALPNEGSRWEYQLKFDGYRLSPSGPAARFICVRATTTTSASATRAS
jgi:hypothetical protein